jgi:long-chain fatty acid transport protein
MTAMGVDLAFAAGFYIPEQGAAATGQGHAVVARGVDASTVFYNPAGITQLEGTQFMLGTTLIAPSMTFSDGGTSTVSPLFGGLDAGTIATQTDADEKVFSPPYLYVTHRFSDGLGIGLGTFGHFGLSTEWPKDWKGRYISYLVDVKTFFVNPSIAFRINSAVRLAAGIQYAYSTVELKKKIALPLWADVNLDLGVADGGGWGYNLGAMIELTPQNTLGVHFRSPVRIHYGGEANYTLPASPCPYGGSTCTAVATALSDTSATTDMTMPALFSIGLANRSIDFLTLEFDIQWIGWSSVDQLVIKFDNPVNPVSITDRKWEDVIALRFGGEYQLSDCLRVRAGYAFDPTPIPGETVDSLLPDADRHDFNAGIGYQKDHFGVDLAYMAVVFKDRHVGNALSAASPVDPATVYNQVGTYTAIAHLAGLSFRYHY